MHTKLNLDNATTPRTRKNIIIKQRGHRCENCFLSEWLETSITLELHHIDGNSDNNTSDNLKLLCPNCHSMTENYKAKNIGNGSTRSSYRKSVYNGK